MSRNHGFTEEGIRKKLLVFSDQCTTSLHPNSDEHTKNYLNFRPTYEESTGFQIIQISNFKLSIIKEQWPKLKELIILMY